MTELVAEANVSEGTFEQREMTNEEKKKDADRLAETKKRNDLELAIEEEKLLAKNNLLAKLGITADEAKLLLL